MSDIKAALKAEIDAIKAARDDMPFGLSGETEEMLAVMEDALKALSQRDAQIAALKADFIRLDRQMSVLEQTGITDRDRADKAEAQIAELAKQEAVGVARMELTIGKEGLRYYQCFVDMRPDIVVSELNTGMELFTRPAPQAPLVVNEVLHTATAAIYFDDSSDFGPALWSIVRAINPEIAELLEKDSSGAFNKTAQLSSCNRESVTDE